MEQKISLNQFKSLQKELAEAKKNAEEYLNGWKRAKADYINREKEIEKEKEEWGKFANVALILQILPILDNFKRAITQINTEKNINQHILNDRKNDTKTCHPGAERSGAIISCKYKTSVRYYRIKAWIEGVKQIKNQLENLLKGLGLEEIKTEGEKFDPSLHESTGKEKVEGKEENIILKEVEAGYKLHGRVIRPAKVVVS